MNSLPLFFALIYRNQVDTFSSNGSMPEKWISGSNAINFMHFFFQILVVLQLISNQLVSDAFFMLVMATKSATVIQTSKKDSWSPFHRTSNGLKCQFSNIKHTWKCSFFGNRTQTPYFWLQTVEHRMMESKYFWEIYLKRSTDFVIWVVALFSSFKVSFLEPFGKWSTRSHLLEKKKVKWFESEKRKKKKLGVHWLFDSKGK